MASSPLIVEARLLPSNLSSSLRTRSDDGACSGNRGVWPAHPRQQGDRAASAPGQVESHLGRTRLTSDAPYKACSILVYSDDHKGRGQFPARKVARLPAPDRGMTARYFAVISAGMAAPSSFAKRNVLPSTQIR